MHVASLAISIPSRGEGCNFPHPERSCSSPREACCRPHLIPRTGFRYPCSTPSLCQQESQRSEWIEWKVFIERKLSGVQIGELGNRSDPIMLLMISLDNNIIIIIIRVRRDFPELQFQSQLVWDRCFFFNWLRVVNFSVSYICAFNGNMANRSWLAWRWIEWLKMLHLQ